MRLTVPSDHVCHRVEQPRDAAGFQAELDWSVRLVQAVNQ